jgi:hypothetical protein
MEKMHLSDSTLYETLNPGDGFLGCKIFFAGGFPLWETYVHFPERYRWQKD